MASPSRTFYFLVTWLTISTVHLCLCCMEGEGNFGWKCNTTTGCFCKEGQRCQRTLGNCPEHCVDNPWGVGCQDEPMNLAYGKPVTQSSIYSDDRGSYPGNLAVDGDNKTDNLKCARSDFEVDPTWSVNLRGLYVIRKVVVVKPDTEENICPFGLVQLCINNDTTSRPRLGCWDISVPNTVTRPVMCATAALEYIIDPPILASHVTIYKKHRQIIRLCEVIVRGYTYPYNIAYGKTASQSSVVDGGLASRAIDGGVNTVWEGGSCTQTAEEEYPWWKVDLREQYAVFSVTLFTRTVGNQLTNVRLKSKNHTVDQYSDVCTPLVTALPSGVGIELTCSPPFVGQILLVQVMVPQEVLSLCEVSVKGYKYQECTGGMFGPGCRYQSDCNCEREERCGTLTACTAYPYLTTSPSVATRSDTSLILRWHRWTPLTAPGVGTVHNYVIKAWRDGSLVSYAVVSKDSTTGTVGGLSPYMEYNVTITIRSDTGSEGYPSPITTARTCGDPLKPPAPYVTSHLDTSNMIAYIVLKTVGMEHAIHRCDGFARLNIRYVGEYGNKGMIEVLNVTDSQLINITNLTTYSRYTIRVSAVSNINLEGPAVTMILTTPEGIPGKMEPPTFAMRHQAGFQISWTSPYPPGGILTGYQIMYGKRGDSWTALQADSGETYKNIDDILFNTSYIFKIRASTVVGHGSYSDVIQALIIDNMISTGHNCDSSATVAVIIVAGILVTTAIIIAVIIVIRIRRQLPPSDSQKRQSPDITNIGQPTTPPSTNTYCTLNQTYVNQEFQETEYSEINVAVDDGSKN